MNEMDFVRVCGVKCNWNAENTNQEAITHFQFIDKNEFPGIKEKAPYANRTLDELEQYYILRIAHVLKVSISRSGMTDSQFSDMLTAIKDDLQKIGTIWKDLKESKETVEDYTDVLPVDIYVGFSDYFKQCVKVACEFLDKLVDKISSNWVLCTNGFELNAEPAFNFEQYTSLQHQPITVKRDENECSDYKDWFAACAKLMETLQRIKKEYGTNKSIISKYRHFYLDVTAVNLLSIISYPGGTRNENYAWDKIPEEDEEVTINGIKFLKLWKWFLTVAFNDGRHTVRDNKPGFTFEFCHNNTQHSFKFCSVPHKGVTGLEEFLAFLLKLAQNDIKDFIDTDFMDIEVRKLKRGYAGMLEIHTLKESEPTFIPMFQYPKESGTQLDESRFATLPPLTKWQENAIAAVNSFLDEQHKRQKAIVDKVVDRLPGPNIEKTTADATQTPPVATKPTGKSSYDDEYNKQFTSEEKAIIEKYEDWSYQKNMEEEAELEWEIQEQEKELAAQRAKQEEYQQQKKIVLAQKAMANQLALEANKAAEQFAALPQTSVTVQKNDHLSSSKTESTPTKKKPPEPIRHIYKSSKYPGVLIKAFIIGDMGNDDESDEENQGKQAFKIEYKSNLPMPNYLARFDLSKKYIITSPKALFVMKQLLEGYESEYDWVHMESRTWPGDLKYGDALEFKKNFVEANRSYKARMNGIQYARINFGYRTKKKNNGKKAKS